MMEREEAIILSRGRNNDIVIENLGTTTSNLCIAILGDYGAFFQSLESEIERRLFSQCIVEGITSAVFPRPKFFERITIGENDENHYFKELYCQEVTNMIFTYLDNTPNNTDSVELLRDSTLDHSDNLDSLSSVITSINDSNDDIEEEKVTIEDFLNIDLPTDDSFMDMILHLENTSPDDSDD